MSRKKYALSLDVSTNEYENLSPYEKECTTTITDIIEQTETYCEDYISTIDSIEYYMEQNASQVEALAENLIYDEGASKICITLRDFNWVVKISNHPDYDEVLCEVALYQEAKRQGIEKFFPRTILTPFECYSGTIVLQEKISFAYHERWEHPNEVRHTQRMTRTLNRSPLPEKVINKTLKVTSNRRKLPIDWIDLCISLYGKKQIQELTKFIHQYDISDLHNGNIGYCLTPGKRNNTIIRPVIFDFSGYKRPDNY